MTRLDELLGSIDPQRTSDQIARRVDEAINTFPPGPGRITRFDDFVAYTVRFCRHVEAKILGLRAGLPGATRDFDLGRLAPVLARACGAEGLKTGFEMSRTGNEGGWYAWTRKLAETLAEQYAEHEIAARVGSYWSGLSTAEKLAAGDEYLAKHGHLLPSEITEGGAGRIRANLPRVLQEHPRLLQRLRRVGR